MQQLREQFELYRMYEALQQRFFPARVTQPQPLRCFDIDITRDGAWWRVRIPECVSSSDLAPAVARILAPPLSAGLFASGGGFAGA